MLFVCVRDVVFSVCIVTRGDVGARVWEVLVFRHAAVVCLCLLCILHDSFFLFFLRGRFIYINKLLNRIVEKKDKRNAMR